MDREKHPELNWKEADEVHDEDLEAAASLYDRIITETERACADAYDNLEE